MSQLEWALVTGASRGIGAATAIELAKKGFAVILNYQKNQDAVEQVANQIKGAGGTVQVFQSDVSSCQQVKEMFEKIEDTLGPISTLVCNAGMIQDTLLGASTTEDFESVLNLNLGGVVNCCREASRRMVSRRSGVILNISSVAAQRPGRGQSNYAASKGAVESFTRALAVELAPRGIRVNAVAPGVVATSMTAELRELAGQEILKRISLKRIGKPEEIAKVVAFLCSEDASYVTGQIWSVDGGFKLE